MEPVACIATVDDEASVRHGLERLLRAHGFAVEGYGSATQFLDSLATRRPNCVLLDLHMPGVGGFEVLETLQTMAIPVPVIVVTGDCSPSIKSRATALGARQCLSKPIDEEHLLAAIRDAI